jgi:hypothetical protein
LKIEDKSPLLSAFIVTDVYDSPDKSISQALRAVWLGRSGINHLDGKHQVF